MIASRWLSSWLVFVGIFAAKLLAGAFACAQTPLPTAEQIVAGYRQNVATFPAPHITIYRAERPTEALRTWWQRKIAEMEKGAVDPARSDVQRQQAQAIVENARAALAERQGDASFHLDYWSDRQNWQARIPFEDGAQDGKDSELGVGFPSEAPSAANLATLFAGYRIYNYSPASKPAARAWFGIPNPGAPAYARVSDAVLNEMPLTFELPPLAAPSGPAAALAHPIDAIFLRGDALRVLERTKVGTRDVIKVEQALLAPSNEPHRTAGELTAGDVITAWLDPAQGYLPLRAEWRRELRFNGRPLNAEHRHLHHVVRNVRIERTPGAGFYPLAGTIESLAPEPLSPRMPSIDELIAGKKFNPRLIADSETNWNVDVVEPRGGGNPQIYKFAFPERTEIFNEASLTAPGKLVPLPTGQTAPALRVTRWSDGRERSLDKMRGRVVVLYFWMAWQEPCMAPLAVLSEIERKYANQKVTVLGIHVGNIGMAELTRAATAGGANFPQALDVGTDQTAGSTLAHYHVQLYPTTVIIDRQGRIAFSTDDEQTGALSRQAAAKLGLRFPLPESLSPEEEAITWNRIFATMISAQLDRAVTPK